MEFTEVNYIDTENLPTSKGETLTSRLADMLIKAELIFGNRVINHTILGVSYHKDGPRTIPLQDNRGMLVIQLGRGTENNCNEALFQLAHEVIHCFAKDSNSDRNTNIEEGLATYFAQDYVKGFYAQPAPSADRTNYVRAYDAVKRLLDCCPDVIKRIRSSMEKSGKQSFFSEITPQIIRDHCCNISIEDATLLTQPFPNT